MNNFPHLAQRIFNVPVAIHPQKAEIIVSALAHRLGVINLTREDGTIIVASSVASKVSAEPEDHGYEVKDGIAIIPISGTLVHKNGQLRPYSGITGYDGIRHNFFSALENPKVKAIAFDIDSPGGEVSGCFDLVDTIYGARGEKPIVAILTESAFSAAYAIASACDRIWVPRTGGTGSIGVIAMHVDYSEALSNAGIKVSLIQYGKRKSEAAEVRPLSDAARAKMQRDVDTMGEMFVETVARNRKLSTKKIRATEAGIFLGAEGVDVGLADGVMPPEDAFADLLELVS